MKRVLVLLDVAAGNSADSNSNGSNSAVAAIAARLTPFFPRCVSSGFASNDALGPAVRDAKDELPELAKALADENATDVYLLSPEPTERLLELAELIRRQAARVYAIVDTWTNTPNMPNTPNRTAREQRLIELGVALIRSSLVDAGCCV